MAAGQPLHEDLGRTLGYCCATQDSIDILTAKIRGLCFASLHYQLPMTNLTRRLGLVLIETWAWSQTVPSNQRIGANPNPKAGK
jgi:hypothetical protein